MDVASLPRALTKMADITVAATWALLEMVSRAMVII